VAKEEGCRMRQTFKEYIEVKQDQWKRAILWLASHGHEINEHNVELIVNGIKDAKQFTETVEQK